MDFQFLMRIMDQEIPQTGGNRRSKVQVLELVIFQFPIGKPIEILGDVEFIVRPADDVAGGIQAVLMGEAAVGINRKLLIVGDALGLGRAVDVEQLAGAGFAVGADLQMVLPLLGLRSSFLLAAASVGLSAPECQTAET